MAVAAAAQLTVLPPVQSLSESSSITGSFIPLQSITLVLILTIAWDQSQSHYVTDGFMNTDLEFNSFYSGTGTFSQVLKSKSGIHTFYQLKHFLSSSLVSLFSQVPFHFWYQAYHIVNIGCSNMHHDVHRDDLAKSSVSNQRLVPLSASTFLDFPSDSSWSSDLLTDLMETQWWCLTCNCPNFVGLITDHLHLRQNGVLLSCVFIKGSWVAAFSRLKWHSCGRIRRSGPVEYENKWLVLLRR